MSLNLLPQAYRENRRQGRADVLCMAMFFVIILGAQAALLIQDRRIRATEGVYAVTMDRIREASSTVDKLNVIEVRKSSLLRLVKEAEALEEKLPRSRALASVIVARPPTVQLIRFDFQVVQVVPTKSSMPGMPIPLPGSAGQARERLEARVQGLAAGEQSVAAFMTELRANPLIEIVTLSYSRETRVDPQGAPSSEFEMVVEFRADMDAASVPYTGTTQPSTRSTRSPATQAVPESVPRGGVEAMR